MIETWTTMEHDQSRLLAHRRRIKRQFRADNIKKDPLAFNRYKHGSTVSFIREALELHQRNIRPFVVGNRAEELPL